MHMEFLKTVLTGTFSLKDDVTSQDEIYDRLVTGAALRGTNMCVLILANLIACIGLNMNSTAVIIGAMLISPLMGSIMAIAYGIASGDVKIVERFAIGFSMQILICLVTSTVYFSITPISDSTSELLARTAPTVWDVLIGLFGGLAGIIGMTRKEKSNVIPGVAIATALMPPLCTAGYGIAAGQWQFFLGAFYLFLLNSYFICLSSIVVLIVLKVPRHTYMEVKIRKKVIHRVLATTLVLIIPSFLFAADLIRQTDITGFEEQAHTELFALGTEAQALFPQVDEISVGDMDCYRNGELVSYHEVTIFLTETLPPDRETMLRDWLSVRCSASDVIELVVRN